LRSEFSAEVGKDTGAGPRIKVCCIASSAEAGMAVRHGAWAVGLVSSMPSGPGVIPEETIAEIAASVPSVVATFLLTSSREPREIIDQQRRCGVDTIQLCDWLAPETLIEIREALPGIRLVQVVHVVDDTAIDEAENTAPHADALLLDSGNPRKSIKELGGTGRVHDWSISRRIREGVDVPVFLAGGLTPENVAEAVRQVRPFGVDVCSGLRTGDHLDEDKLALFVQALEAL